MPRRRLAACPRLPGTPRKSYLTAKTRPRAHAEPPRSSHEPAGRRSVPSPLRAANVGFHGGARWSRASGGTGQCGMESRQGSLRLRMRGLALLVGMMVLVPSAQAAAAATVTIDDVSDTLVGSADTGTDVTWHADGDGTYSVRVGLPEWSLAEAATCT